MSFQSYREGSKANWGVNGQESLTLEQVQTGAILRIADATEKMAVNHAQLLRDLDYYKGAYKSHQNQIDALSRSNAALKGQITKLKKAAKTAAEKPE